MEIHELDIIEQHMQYLDDEIDSLEDEILARIASEPELKRDYMLLTSIDGIGQNAAVTFLGELSAAANFASARELEVFCGVAPRLHESGSSVKLRSRMSKVGNSRMRSALFMPALCALRSNPVLRAFAAKLRAAGKPGRLIIGAIMRKLLRYMFAVIKSGKPFDPNFRSVRPHLINSTAAI